MDRIKQPRGAGSDGQSRCKEHLDEGPLSPLGSSIPSLSSPASRKSFLGTSPEAAGSEMKSEEGEGCESGEEAAVRACSPAAACLYTSQVQSPRAGPTLPSM